jgi:predicted transcriptional regulator
VRSVRLDPELDRKVRKAAAVRGESVSAFIRNAAAKQAEETLAERGRERFRDVEGAVHGGGGRARRTGEAFTEIVSRPGTAA